MPPAGDSSVVQTYYDTGFVKRVDLAVTFDTGDGSFMATALTKKIDGFLVKIQTNPDGSPTDNYDITLPDANGIDALQGAGVDRDTTNSEEAQIVYAGTGNHPCVCLNDTLTLTITGNTDTSATTAISIWWVL